jgi:hypothetical protein
MPLLRRAPACLLAASTLVIHSLAIAAPPPDQPEPEVTVDQPEPEPTVEPEPELPSWNVALPSFDQAPEAEPLLQPQLEPETPPDGNGATVVGAMLLGGGVVLTAASVSLIFFDWDEVGLWIAGSVVGSLAITAGFVTLFVGTAKRNRYEPWRLQHAAPPRGTGLIAGGSLAVSAGAFGMLLGGISLPREDADDLPYGAVTLSLGAVSVATGIALLVVGAKRRRSFNEWDRTRVTPSFSMAPGPLPRTASPTFGIAGRF